MPLASWGTTVAEHSTSWGDFAFVGIWGVVILAAFVGYKAPELMHAINRGAKGAFIGLGIVIAVVIALVIGIAILTNITWAGMVLILLFVIAAGVWANVK